VGLVLLVIIAGLVIGSLLGDLVGGVLPAGRIQEVFTRGPSIGLTPAATLDLHFLAVTFGLVFKVNLVGVLGIVIAALALRRL
jgi:uncharacterized protein DUF4321